MQMRLRLGNGHITVQPHAGRVTLYFEGETPQEYLKITASPAEARHAVEMLRVVLGAEELKSDVG